MRKLLLSFLIALIISSAAPAQGKVHSITLNWNAAVQPTGVTTAGYKIFRETSAGACTLSSTGTGPGCLLLNSTLVTGTTFTDTTGIGGTTYWYVVVTVDSNGFQSVYSNEVSAIFLVNPAAPILNAPVSQ